MTTLRETLPLLRVPPLEDTPALARVAVGVAWLVVSWSGRPAATAFLLLIATALLFAAAGHSPAAIARAAWRPMVAILLVGLLVFLLTADAGRLASSQVTLLVIGRLSLLLVIVLVVALPQDAEAALTESLALLSLPPRIPFAMLIATRVLVAVPSDLASFRAARRARDLARHGLSGLVTEPLAALAYLWRAARHRWRSLRTSAQLAALGSGPRRSMYRSVSFGHNGRYVLAGGLLVAVVGLLIGLT